MHPILRYLKAREITQVAFARQLGVSPSFLNDIIHGRSRPGREKRLDIVEVTGGAISLADLDTWEPEDAAA